MQKDKSSSATDISKEQTENQPGPHREEVPKEKIDPKTETNLDPHDDGDGEGG